jgi:hypothetical protein
MEAGAHHSGSLPEFSAPVSTYRAVIHRPPLHAAVRVDHSRRSTCARTRRRSIERERERGRGEEEKEGSCLLVLRLR